MVNIGWVKLYRELKSKSIWQLSTPQQKVVLITILMTVNHEENKWEWQGKEYYCKPGQMITSLNSIVQECGQGVTTQNVRTALDRFEKLGFLTNESTKAGRLITVINWDKYQGSNFENEKQLTKELTKQNREILKSEQNSTKELTMLLTKHGVDDNTIKSIISENSSLLVTKPLTKELTNDQQRPNKGLTKELTPIKEYKNIKNDKNTLPLTPSRGEGEGNKNFIDTFWENYPKKVGRGNVEKWFNKNKPNEEQFQVMLNKLEEFKKTNQWEKSDGRFIPNPINWLNAKSWEDESSIDGMIETREEEIARLEKKVQQMKKSGEWK